MIKKIVLVPFLAMSFAITEPVLAHSAHHASATTSCGCHKDFNKIIHSLKLDDSQKAKIKMFKQQTKADRKATQQQLNALDTQINSLTTAPTLDDKKLDDLLNQKSALIKAIMKNKIVVKNQIYNVLNPQQQQQVQQMMTKKK